MRKLWLWGLIGVAYGVGGCFPVPVETKFLADAEFCDSLGLVLSLEGDKCVSIADHDGDGDVLHEHRKVLRESVKITYNA